MKFASNAFGLVAAGCMLGGAVAQSDECTASTDANFDFQVTASDDLLTVHWRVDTAAEEVTFQVVYAGEGWVGLGFNSDGLMVPSDAVIGLPDDNSVLEYYLAAYTISADDVMESQEVSAESIVQAGSTTTLVFTRPLAPTSSRKAILSAEEGEEVTFIWAWGSSNALAYHSDRGAVTVSDLLCTTIAAGTTTDATSDTDGTEDVADPDAAETAGGDCTSSDPDYDFEIAPDDDLTISWILVGSSVSVKAVYQGEAYLAIGFSEDGKMPGSDAVIGLPDEGTASEYDMDSYGFPEEAVDQEITGATITQEDGVTTLTFVRPLEPTGDGKQILSLAEPTVWLYAWGGSNTFEQHTVAYGISVSLDACSFSGADRDGTKLEYAHGWLMVLGWTVCFPVGIMYARFSSSFKDVGFPAHRLLQTLGSVLVIAGLIIAIVFTEDFGLDHFETNHGKIGLVLTILMGLQVVAAALRPSKPPAEAVVHDADGHAKPAPVSNVRRAWAFLHRGLGYVAVIWAIFQCFSGLYRLGADDVWQLLYLLLAIAMVFAFVVLQILACCRLKRERPRDYPGPHPHGAGVTGTQTH